nr:peptide-methionine (S)-S-oxide reductase [uncultured Psychroserpens sp.]
MKSIEKIGLGGGCHWCTEAVFQSVKGVISVEQGYIASIDDNATFSEGIIITFNLELIDLRLLIDIHLITHKSTKNHSMRDKYRSAIYTFSDTQKAQSKQILHELGKEYYGTLVTLVLDFNAFKMSRNEITNYYYNNPEKPFCKAFINPKLKLLLKDYGAHVNHEKLSHLKVESIE